MSVYPRGKKYFIDVTINKKRYLQGGFKARNDALVAQEKLKEELLMTKLGKSFLDDLKEALRSGLGPEEDQKPSITFYELYKKAQKDCRARSKSDWPKTREAVVEKWMTKFFNKPCHTITRESIEEYLYERADQYPGGWTANSDLKIISSIFNYGVERRLIKSNPAKGIKKYKTSRVRPFHVPSILEVQRLLQVAKNDKEQDWILAFVNSGQRFKGVTKLKKSDINSDKGIARVKDQKDPKGEHAHPLKINKVLMGVFQRQFQRYPKSEWVFPNPKTGKPYKDRRKLLDRLCTDAGIKRITHHMFRHHVASRGDEKGLSHTEIMEITGHQDIKTLTNYLHEIRGARQSPMDAIMVDVEENVGDGLRHENTAKTTASKARA